jgi:hypothetical protein
VETFASKASSTTMIKFLSTLSLLFYTQFAKADWVEIGKNETGTFFVHATSIERNGDLVKMWFLIDFKRNQVDSSTRSFRSTKDQTEYDCKEQRTRTLYYNNYAEKMGTGKIVFTMKDPFKWRPVAIGSISENLFNIACGKK